MYGTNLRDILFLKKKHPMLYNEDIRCYGNIFHLVPKLFYVKLAKYLSLHNILYNGQYWFRKGHSTVHGVAEFANTQYTPLTSNKVP